MSVVLGSHRNRENSTLNITRTALHLNKRAEDSFFTQYTITEFNNYRAGTAKSYEISNTTENVKPLSERNTSVGNTCLVNILFDYYTTAIANKITSGRSGQTRTF